MGVTIMNDDDKPIKIKDIKNFFKKNKSDEVKELEEEAKEVEKEIKYDIDQEAEKVTEIVEENEKILEINEKVVEQKDKAEEFDKEEKEIKQKEEKINQEIKETKKEISELKEEVKTEKDETIKFDLGKIKSFFKPSESKDFFKKYGVFLLLLIPIFLAVFFRAYPYTLPATDDWAENSVTNALRNQISTQIGQQYPNLPEQNRAQLIEDELQKILKERSDEIQQQIDGTSNYFKSKLQNENDQTYLLAIDPYLWYGQARNIINNGHPGDDLVDGKPVHTLRGGRFDKPVNFILHPYISAYLYKFINIFNKKFTVLKAAFILPLLLIGLSIIPVFFITKRFGGSIGALFGGIILATNAALLGRTPAGFSDTDAYNIFFPLFAAWLFIESMYTKKVKDKIILCGLSGLAMGLYAVTWGGWWYVFHFMLATIGVYLITTLIKSIRESGIKEYVEKQKGILITFGSFIVSVSVFVILMRGFDELIKGLIKKPLSIITLKQVGIKSIWPNVLTTVAEFNEQALSSIISQMGGPFLFLIALSGTILLLVNKKKIDLINMLYLSASVIYYAIIISIRDTLNSPIKFIVVLTLPIIIGIIKIIYLKEDYDRMSIALLLIIWIAGTAYGFTKGVRFAILMVPAIAISFGIAIGTIYESVSKWISTGLNINKILSKSAIFLVLALLLIGPIISADKVAKQEIPSMNDAWYESLTAIKNDADDAITTSWWDFGHWFVIASERRVTFDGGDQTSNIHWVGKTLLESNEEITMGVLKMLNCGQERAFGKLDEFIKEQLKSYNIMMEIIVLEREDAKDLLMNYSLSENEAEEVLSLTHCEDIIPQYYITSQDMIGKAGVWAHFGSWDFEKASMYNKVYGRDYDTGINILTEQFNLSTDSADTIYYEIQSNEADKWISPWPSYRSGLASCSIQNNVAICGNGAEINLETYETKLNIQGGVGVPYSVVYANKDGLEEIVFEESQVPISVALIPNGNGFDSILMDKELGRSTFTRLFFFDGHGSQHFTILSDKTTINNEKIKVWRVNFESQEKLILESLKDKKDKIVKSGDSISVGYIGSLDNGTLFDSNIVDYLGKGITSNSKVQGQDIKPFDFVVGQGQVIKGFDDVVMNMKINDTTTVTILPEEAYGTDPNAHPLGNQTLKFKILILDIK